MTKEEAINLLKSGIVTVEFIKKDGCNRVMLCTLNDKLFEYESKTTKKSNPDVQAVWDTEANGFRSFRWDSVIKIDGEEVSWK